MKNGQKQKKGATGGAAIEWTSEDRERHRAIRELFREWHPSPEELIASGEGANFNRQGEFRGLRRFVAEMKQTRVAVGLTLAEVSRRCGSDQPALSRLESGRNKNPTLDTLWRYAAALGQRLILSSEAIPDTRSAKAKAKANDVRTTRKNDGRNRPSDCKIPALYRAASRVSAVASATPTSPMRRTDHRQPSRRDLR